MSTGGQAPKSQETVCGLASELWAHIFSRLEDSNGCLGYQDMEQQDLDEAEHAAFSSFVLFAKLSTRFLQITTFA